MVSPSQIGLCQVNEPNPPSIVSNELSKGEDFCACGPVRKRNAFREAVERANRLPEVEALAPLIAQARMDAPLAIGTKALARQLVLGLRESLGQSGRSSRVQSLMQEFALSSVEGVALMCLAEALLRIPDTATRDALIRDKIGQGDWYQHLGRSHSLFVNAASWGLLLTGKLVDGRKSDLLLHSLVRLVGHFGEPLIRKAVVMAMGMLGEQFVTGETIDQALKRARKLEARGFRYSYDMLGEAALNAEDAQRYFEAYEQAIHAIGRAAHGHSVIERAGISIKLSALHPRYCRAQHQRVMAELLPSVLRLTELARHYDIGLNIDAEEADRLELSLDLLEALCLAPSLQGWNGIGFVIQAYQKRCPFVIDFLVDLARRTDRRLIVRLVKGAYWDSEIKRAQTDGLNDYPVYTRKQHTDVSYLACARKLLDAPDSVYPQFATHNAQTVAAILQIAQERCGDFSLGQYEFQCLHGMGEQLFKQVVGSAKWDRPCRIYAPVGTHENLLAYLVRRLLENGANSSFVNRIADTSVPVDDLIKNPVQRLQEDALDGGRNLGFMNPSIPLPGALYGAARQNSTGLDLNHEPTLRLLIQQMREASAVQMVSPMLAVDSVGTQVLQIRNPSDHCDVLGTVLHASAADVDAAVQAALQWAPIWADEPPTQRAKLLEKAADLLEADTPRAMMLLIREAGKTWAHAVSEVREAVDFLRYYAAQVRHDFNNVTHRPLGPVVCISPWNFPLAIFLGQVSAALAAGNTVLAKPAEATPAIAALATQILWQAGIPKAAVQLLPGVGSEVGMQLVCDARVQGVLFTGSTATARVLQINLSKRLNKYGQFVPFIAETGGQNCMVVDSSALLEQVVRDVVASAFEGAGQRCSALRVLFVQEDVADKLMVMLKGAMCELQLGTPSQLSTDVGPVIDERALSVIEKHVHAMKAKGRRVHRLMRGSNDPLPQGTYAVPTLIELDSIDELTQEIFGPVLHLVRYPRTQLDAQLKKINDTGYALTLGIHSRIDETISQIIANLHVGNVYVNRQMVGAVVGVQPFGGSGLSGTGPKAGGPLYVLRLLSQTPTGAALKNFCSNRVGSTPKPLLALKALHDWAIDHQKIPLAHLCDEFACINPTGLQVLLPGPTGESNLYSLLAKRSVLCLTGPHEDNKDDRLVQLAAVLAVGARAIWPAGEEKLFNALPKSVQKEITLVADFSHINVDTALVHGSPTFCIQVAEDLALRDGPIVTLSALAPGEKSVPFWSLLMEHCVSINTSAAGGNASLMSLES